MLVFFFFFQAEDGIRDIGVTGVQTCALPICFHIPHIFHHHAPSSVLFTQVAATGVFHHILYRLAESPALIERTVGVGNEKERHPLSFQEYLLRSESRSQASERYDTQQFLRFGRHRSEAVFEPCTESVHLFVERQTVEFAIEQHALAASRHIIRRKQYLQIAFDLAFVDKQLAADLFRFFYLIRIQLGKFIILQFVHRLSQYFLISFVT